MIGNANKFVGNNIGLKILDRSYYNLFFALTIYEHGGNISTIAE